jgi:glucose-1-phosphatase
MIKAITFDLDGVYFINGKENFFKNLLDLGVEKGKAEEVFFGDKMNKEYKLGKLTDEQFWGWALEKWKLDLTIEKLVDLMIKGYEVNEDVEKIVRKVRSNGYLTLICSNNFPARINGLQKRFGFLDNFDAAVYSHTAGVAKPNKEIFEKLVEESGVKPEEIVFADDNEEKLFGAKEIGIHAFLYEGFDKYLLELKRLGIKLA